MNAAAIFDARRDALHDRCVKLRDEGATLDEIASTLNSEGVRTKWGKFWSRGTVKYFLSNRAAPTAPAAKRRAGKLKRAKSYDRQLGWVKEKHPELESWRLLASEWLAGREKSLHSNLQGINAFITFLADQKLPIQPEVLLLHRTPVPDFYECHWGAGRTHGKILVHNAAHFFIKWVLSRPEFCEEDDEGRILTAPAFRNPIPHLSRTGVPKYDESVRATLPYGYIEELRLMIAQGPNFKDWTWAQNALGRVAALSSAGLVDGLDSGEDDEEDGVKAASVWYQVPEHLIDRTDPDCVWRARVVPVTQGVGVTKLVETIYEMWSPVRWVAMLLKLQLPLRLHQVRLLDSGEADTWTWQDGEWSLNVHPLAKGDEKSPYTNGVFLRPNQLIDGDAKVVLHVNTNKTADIGKWGNAKGYNVPWVVGGPIHQDPFYWLEKLRRWQSKYNPVDRLTSWTELDNRHIQLKTDVQLSSYPHTPFLFRMPENFEAPRLPLAKNALKTPWYRCLEELETRLERRSETLPNGAPIRLTVWNEDGTRKPGYTTLYSLHGLRVSLITALALDGQVPLHILQKIAGHSRLVMTLYYTKPGAMQARAAIQAGVARLNESASSTIIDWLANTEYQQLVKQVIAVSTETFRVAVAEQKHLRTAAGWMAMLDGLCLVGGNNVEFEAPGCHNGGPNIGADSAPRYAPVVGGARNCPMCRWFITRPYFLPQLAARWNNVSYHCYDAKEQVVFAEDVFRSVDDRRADALAQDRVFQEAREHKDAQRALEQAVQKFDALTQTLAAITRLMERCRAALETGEENALLASGGMGEFEYAIEEVDSELLQLSGVCEGSLLYNDLDPGKAVFRQGQLLDAALVRDNLPPIFLTLTEQEQKFAASAFLKQLGKDMNPENPSLGRYQVISLVDARESLKGRLGGAVDEALRIASAQGESELEAQLPALAAA